jgi:hypothetical protein
MLAFIPVVESSFRRVETSHPATPAAVESPDQESPIGRGIALKNGTVGYQMTSSLGRMTFNEAQDFWGVGLPIRPRIPDGDVYRILRRLVE